MSLSLTPTSTGLLNICLPLKLSWFIRSDVTRGRGHPRNANLFFGASTDFIWRGTDVIWGARAPPHPPVVTPLFIRQCKGVGIQLLFANEGGLTFLAPNISSRCPSSLFVGGGGQVAVFRLPRCIFIRALHGPGQQAQARPGFYLIGPGPARI